MALPDYPISRNEQYLAAIAGQEVELPDYPITREEQYLAYIAENGGGGLTPEQEAKLDAALVAPDTAPTEKEIVGVGTDNAQIMFKVGEGLEIEGAASPFTLKASGGSGFSDVWNSAVDFTGCDFVVSDAAKCFYYDMGSFYIVGFDIRGTGSAVSGSTPAFIKINENYRPNNGQICTVYLYSDGAVKNGVAADITFATNGFYFRKLPAAVSTSSEVKGIIVFNKGV